MSAILGGGGGKNVAAVLPAHGVSVQTSLYGVTITVAYGQIRLSGNLIWYGAFQAIAQKNASGGKGGGGGGGGKGGGGGSGSYLYKTSFAMALCEGPINTILNVYESKTVKTLATSSFGLKPGGYTQTPWSYLTTYGSPGVDLAYHGTAYVYAQDYDLGSSAQLPNFGYEVLTDFANAISGQPDADPADVVLDMLTNAHYGIGFPSARILGGAFTGFSAYCRAAGMVSSPVFDSQQSAASYLNDYVTAHNCEFVWSGDTLTIVSYGDQSITANGSTYTAPSAPLFSLSDDDFLDQGGKAPVQLTRARPSDRLNLLAVEWLNRANQYNPEVLNVMDQSAIEKYGLRTSASTPMHFFCNLAAVTMAATLKLQRQSVRNIYTFVLGWKYCLLDPMDIVSITDPGLGITNQWVRIIGIDENDNGDLTITAEEMLIGTGAAPLYSFQTGNPFIADYNAAPGSVNTPLILEPNATYLKDLGSPLPLILIGASGGTNWGGAYIHLSADGGSTYERQNATVTSPARQGVLTAAFASGSDPDTTHTLSVNLTQSLGVLLPGTPGPTGDASSGRTLCAVEGEIVAYSSATLTSAYHYDLGSYVRRGAEATTISGHSIGALFCRLDDAVVEVPLPPRYVGIPLLVKLQSYNKFGAAIQDIATCTAYSYTPGGYASTVVAPTAVGGLMNVLTQNDGTVYTTMNIFWTFSTDPLVDQYEVQYSINGSGVWKSLTVSSAVSVVEVKPVAPGDVYQVRVRGVRTQGGGPYYSNFANGSNQTVIGKAAAPANVSGLTVTPGYRSNDLAWPAVADKDVDGYQIYRGTTNVFGSSAPVQFALANKWTDTNLTAGTTYYYWIVAVNTSSVASVSAYGPVSGVPNLIDTPNVQNNAITANSSSTAFGSDFWVGPGGGATVGPSLSTSGYLVDIDITFQVGNAVNPYRPANALNGYPFYAPSGIILNVRRYSAATGLVLISGVVASIGGGEFIDHVSGTIVCTSGVVHLVVRETPPASAPGDPYIYSFDITPFGTITTGVTYVTPISQAFIQVQEIKK
jgi:hypothetical protein